MAAGARDRLGRRLALSVAAVCAVLSATACLTQHERDRINEWLLCEECRDGQLDVVVDDIDWRAIPRLAGALIGPPPQRVAKVEMQYRVGYQRSGSAEPEATYVARYLSNYRALYQKRAAVALGRIGAKGGFWRTRAAAELRDALARQATDPTTYREDVVRVIDRALFVATGTAQWSAVSAGVERACGVSSSGDGYCWGNNQAGALGDGSIVPRPTPTRIARGIEFTRVSAGSDHTCGRAVNGSAYCWGTGSLGQLGNGDTADQTVPTRVALAFPVLSVAVGGAHTCADSVGGTLYCWGDNAAGQLGDGSTTARNTPSKVLGGKLFATFSTGTTHTCAVTASGEMSCWGGNASGQLGDGTTTDRLVPAAITGTFVAVAAGFDHTCALDAGGSAFCWGANGAGQLGDGTTILRLTPVAVVMPPSPPVTYTAITADSGHTCALAATGAAYCWGRNSAGQVGDGTTVDRTGPVPVAGGLTFAQLSAGAYFTCGVTTERVLYCWGKGSSGQLGTSPASGSLIPVRTVSPPVP